MFLSSMSSSPETHNNMSCHQHCCHGCQSPYGCHHMCCSRLWLRPSQKRRTSVQPEGKHATWNESFHLPVDIVTRQKLVVVLLDHDTIGSDDELGRSLPPCSMLFTRSLEQARSLARSLAHSLTQCTSLNRSACVCQVEWCINGIPMQAVYMQAACANQGSA